MKLRIAQISIGLLVMALLPASPVSAQLYEGPETDENQVAIDDLEPVADPGMQDDGAELAEDVVAGDESDDERLDQREIDEQETDEQDFAEEDYDDEDYEETDEYGIATVPQPTERESELDELRSSFELYKSALANGSYDEADTLAKRLVELAIKIYGINSLDASRALTNLAIVQTKNEDFESAELNFNSAIEIIERVEDRLHVALVNPLRGLATAQLASGRPDVAMRTFTRAVHVTHVNEGPHNLM